MMEHALALASSLDDRDVYFEAASAVIVSSGGPERWRRAGEISAEILAQPRTGVNARTLGLALQFAAVGRLAVGDRQAFDKAFGDLSELALRSQDANVVITTRHLEITGMVMDGRLEDALDTAQRTIALAKENGLYWNVAMVMGGLTAGYLGKAQAFLDTEPENPDQVPTLAATAAFEQLRAENTTRGRQFLDRFLGSYSGQREELVRLVGGMPMLAISTAAVALEDHELAQIELSMPASNIAGPLAVSMARLVGASARIVGDVAAARDRTNEAIAYTAQIRCRPELALSRLQMAEILLDHYPDERAAAIEHLDFAIAEFQAMKMQPALERALRHRGLLKA
jgi:hypothetical protein